MRAWATLLSIALFAWASAASAHTRSVSYSTWHIVGRTATVLARVSLLDAGLLPQGALAEHVAGSVRVEAAQGECRVSGARRLVTEPEWIDLEWSVVCAEGEPVTLASSLLVGENPTHLHLARVERDGVATEHVLDGTARSVTLGPASAPGGSFSRFVALGVEHIAFGWDHLLFVLMLLVAARTLRSAAWTVSGFTLGHSVTLTLAVLGVVVPSEAPVETLIAVSIALLAVENVWLADQRSSRALPAVAVAGVALAAAVAAIDGSAVALALAGLALFAGCYFGLLARSETPERWRGAVAALFGLVHGFGFARVLDSLRLEGWPLARALFGFNLGVELGQVLAIALVWPVLVALRRRSPRPLLGELAACAVLGVACHWVVTRAFGG
jgi:hypothetical protein